MSEHDEDEIQADEQSEEQVQGPEAEGAESDWSDDTNMPFEDPEKKKKGGWWAAS